HPRPALPRAHHPLLHRPPPQRTPPRLVSNPRPHPHLRHPTTAHRRDHPPLPRRHRARRPRPPRAVALAPQALERRLTKAPYHPIIFITDLHATPPNTAAGVGRIVSATDTAPRQQ